MHQPHSTMKVTTRSRLPLAKRKCSKSLFLVSCITAANSLAYGVNRWGPPPITESSSSITRKQSDLRSSSSRSSSRSSRPFFSTVDSNDVETISDDDASTRNKHNNNAPRQLKTCDVLSLDSIRSSLIRQEETIIFALIERSQFRQNQIVYKSGAFGDLTVPGVDRKKVDRDDDALAPLSFLEYMLIGTESLHCAARRYTSPEEHAFFPEYLSESVLPHLDFPENLLSSVGGASEINFNNPKLLRRYFTEIVPAVAKDGDDDQHGSSVVADVTVLQALSRRIHYGKFVAESKYLDDPDTYQKLVDAGDVDGVWHLLTNTEVEKKVLRRSRLKAATYGTDPLLSTMPEGSNNESDVTSIVAAAAAAAVVAAVEAMAKKGITKKLGKIDPAAIESIYRNVVIPMTKEVEVAYLFLRCGKQMPAKLNPDFESILVQTEKFIK